MPHYPTEHNSVAGAVSVPIRPILSKFAKNFPYVPYYVTLPDVVVQGNSLHRGLWLFLPKKWFEAPQRAWLRLEQLGQFPICH